jgi:tetratricopeptide (TPR) repeat protein
MDKSRSTKIAFVSVIIAVACAAGAARAADSIVRLSTKAPLQGTITTITRTEVTIDKPNKESVTVPVNDIRRIRWNGEPAQLSVVRADEETGRLEKAAEGLENLPAISGGSVNLLADVAYLKLRIRAKQALVDNSLIDAVLKDLDAFRKQQKDSYHYFDSLRLSGDLALAKQDFVTAATAYEELGEAPWEDAQMAAQSAQAQVLLAQDDITGAEQAFDAVLAMPADDPAEQAQRQAALLGKAHCLQRRQQFEEAIKVLDQVIAEVDGSQSAVLAAAYVRQGDNLQAVGRTKEAVLAYLHVDILFAGEKSLHAEALYQLSRLWAAVGKPDRAAEATAKLTSTYPNSAWTAKLATGN